MKITTSTKSLSTAAKKYARIVFEENTTSTKVRENGGITEIAIGVGPYKKITARKLRSIARDIARTAQAHKCTHAAVELHMTSFPLLATADEQWFYATLVENIVIAQYTFTKYKTNHSTVADLVEVCLFGKKNKKATEGIKQGVLVGTYVNLCRDIANTPGGDMTPKSLAAAAKQAVSKTAATAKILNKKEIEREKMGALLGVARGASEEPQFIVLEYWGAGKSTKKQSTHTDGPIIFVGKGITFDTGGLNLKPSEGILDMHLDMSGGAAVIAAIACIAKLGIRKNIIGLIPAAENSVSSESFRPGDVLVSKLGKTIDVLNTDAEGRLVLADALTYAEKYNPKLVVDIATLTGAAVVALGQHASALMTKDEEVSKTLLALGEESGDYLWRLPLWDEYKQYTKGLHGDIANIQSKGNPRAGGSINGGMFLSHFTEKYPWAHIDMAPRMTPAPGDKLSRGATGEPVRLLVAIAQKYI